MDVALKILYKLDEQMVFISTLPRLVLHTFAQCKYTLFGPLSMVEGYEKCREKVIISFARHFVE